MQRHTFRMLSIYLLIAMLLAACGGQEEVAPQQLAPTEAPAVEESTEKEAETASEKEAETETPSDLTEIKLPPVDPADSPGDIVSAGSSIVFPLAEVIAGLYEGEGGGNVTIDSIGSGGGFERFCETGETDVSNASRPIKSSERESCAAFDHNPIEFHVCTDAIAISVSTENVFLTDVTLEELAAIFSTAENWSDVRPVWLNEAILRYIPGIDSGTFDYFVEVIFDEDKEPVLNASYTQLSEDDDVLV